MSDLVARRIANEVLIEIKEAKNTYPTLKKRLECISTVVGEPGPQGERGPQGLQGAQGFQGIKGDTGLQGIQGPKGDTGIQGIPGVKGDTGAQGIQGIQGTQGARGLQGLQGIKGDTGLQGIKGDKGDKGDPGEDASALTGTSLPVAGPNYRGKIFTLLGSTGIADKPHICVKLSNETYSWIDMLAFKWGY